MVTKFLFKDRDGRTPLPEEFKKDLQPEYAHLELGGELDEAEEDNIVDGLIWLEDQLEDPKDWMFWERLHNKLFNKVWKWAGRFRKHELMNDDFNHPGYIQENIKKLEGDLKYWLSAKSKMDRKEAIARFHERLLTIHPFSNGNGRTSRILAEHICKYEGIPIPTWGSQLRHDTKKHRAVYIDAVEKARHKLDFRDLIKFMFE